MRARVDADSAGTVLIWFSDPRCGAMRQVAGLCKTIALRNAGLSMAFYCTEAFPFPAPETPFLPDEKAPLPLQLMFPVDFRVRLILAPPLVLSGAQSLPEWPGTTLGEPPRHGNAR